MSNRFLRGTLLYCQVVALLILASPVLLADQVKDAAHKIVIQVSTADPQTQAIALSNAVNLQKEFGPDNIAIEIVAYGPALGLLTTESTQADRVKSLAMQNITFSACSNSMKNIEAKSGKKLQLLEGVQVVNFGTGRILKLQEQGYAYIRP